MESLNPKPQNDKPYYLAELDDEGNFVGADTTKQLIIEIDSEVRFRLRRGCKVSREAVMLVNKPLYNEETGQTVFTVTQPMLQITDDLDPEDIAPKDFTGSQLDYRYLERVQPHNAATSMNLDFRITFPQAGSFFVQIEYVDQQRACLNYSQPIYINVEPVLVVGERKLKCKQLSIITVLSRCLGQMARWEEICHNISQLGYNAIHFTPIQTYGESYSHYSLADQTSIDDYYFGQDAAKLSRDDRLKQLKQTIDHLREEYGLLGIVDIVLNHTASNSEWLIDHPEAAYNTDDCPHLMSAYVLDKALADFSDDFAERRNVSECPSAPYVNNEQDLKAVLGAIQNRVINRLNLHEYFMCDAERNANDLKTCIRTQLTKEQIDQYKKKFDKKKWLTQDPFKILTEKLTKGHGVERNMVSLDLPIAAAYFSLLNNGNEDKAYQQVKALLYRHNDDWKGKVAGFMKEAMESFEGNIRYFKIELKDTKITKENKLLKRYFREIPNDRQSKVAHNGWIGNADPMKDFAMVDWNYLRRSINVWQDSVKLRYGKCPADSPYLWEHMSRYVSDMATVFDGFRLDNAHSTPIHVCNYLLQVARTSNPNLFVMAELFTSSAIADAIFVQKLNLNGLVREMQNTYDAKQLGDYFHQLTCREAVLGLVDEEFEDVNSQRFKKLKPKKPSDIIYDMTHDNPTLLEKFRSPRMALPFIGVNAMADQPIATTFCYDLLLPENLNVVKEKRLYAVHNQDNLYQVDGKDPNCRRKSHREGSSLEEEKKISPERTPEPAKKEFQYEFVFYKDSVQRVQIAGCFTSWVALHDLQRSGGNKWTLSLTLPIIEGQPNYQYKYVINNGSQWECNPQAPQVKDPKGNTNNLIEMPGQHTHQQAPPQQMTQNLRESNFPDIRYARMQLNDIHEECARMNAEIFLHQQASDVLVIIRQFQLDYSNSFDAYVSITRHCYYQEGGEYNYQTSIELPGYLQEVVFCGYLEIGQNSYHNFYNDKQQIRGANANFKMFKDLGQFCNREKIQGQEREKLNFFKMPPSFTCIVKTRCAQSMKDAVRILNELNAKTNGDIAAELFRNAPLSAFNHLLFRCDSEELEISDRKRGPYGLEKYGAFKYAGIASFMHIFRKLKVSGDMGHELFNNMRNGNWFIEYTLDRLSFMKDDGGLSNTIEFMSRYFANVKRLDASFRPKYGSRVIEKVYNAVVFEIINNRMTDHFINNSEDSFVQSLALGVIQMHGRVPSAYFYNHRDTLAAGLAHFSTGYTRCWGRDTFIALRGLYISTGLIKEAKEIIFFFARLMRHGLIPNLHDRGNNTRYNARDAAWFFLQAIKDFVIMSGNEGLQLLQEEVELHFRDNNQQVHWDRENRKEPRKKLTIEDLIQEILQSHAQGIEFREWNAGTQIDGCMKDAGFNVKIVTDPETGFCFGGNAFNCGTWMDKMGSSEKTGNRGIPATPRDGAPIELVAMQYSALRFMETMSEQGHVKHQGVHLKNGTFWTYKEWADKMKEHFERCFWVPNNDSEDAYFAVDKKLVNRRGIYKDTLRPSAPYTEYQLRPNLCVAMAYAPDLFNHEHARICLKNVENILMETGCMGIKTLDPSDRNYKGDYINSDDSQGWNYHQGPEWLWPVGFFLKAKMIFESYDSKVSVQEDVMKWLIPHEKYIVSDKWEGLPELTNSHGTHCPDSCTTQAWSISSVLDALRDLYYS